MTQMFLGMQVMVALGAGVISMLCYSIMPSLAIALLTTMVALILANQRWEVV